MHIEFIDLFRCPLPHEETWLVAAFSQVSGRFVVEGKLGCPVCGAEYPIRSGVADFGDWSGITRNRPASEGDAADASPPLAAAGDEEVMRVAAMLALSRPGMLVLLGGSMTPLAHHLSTLASVRVVTLNATSADSEESEAVASIRVDAAIPVASRSVDGIALDARGISSVPVAEVARVLKPGGRLAAPVSLTLPASMREIARDDRHVVAESVGELVILGR